jgi:uncharacterized protein with GYD domain
LASVAQGHAPVGPALVDVPDHASSATASLAVAASGMARVKTVVLMTPEEMDQAAKKNAGYRPPGQ